VSLAPIWIALAVLAAKDGCGSDAKPAAGSASSAGSAVTAPTLAPAAAAGSGSAAPTTTTMSRDAQAKLDKLVGAKPGTHKRIKPSPEPPPPVAAAGSDAGSAAPKPAKPRNLYPNYGRAMSEGEMFELPDMDLARDKESWDYGATVRQGQSPAPRYVAYRCITKPTCHGWSSMGSDWKIVGWWGTDY
jgi:hypothetical protein